MKVAFFHFECNRFGMLYSRKVPAVLNNASPAKINRGHCKTLMIDKHDLRREKTVYFPLANQRRRDATALA